MRGAMLTALVGIASASAGAQQFSLETLQITPLQPTPEEPAQVPAEPDSDGVESSLDSEVQGSVQAPELLELVDVPPHAWGPPALLEEGDPESTRFIGPRLTQPLHLLGAEVEAGSKARLEWKASQSFSGSEVVSPVLVAHGIRQGPRLCLTAAVHGDELNGVEIVRRIANALDPAEMSGSVIAVPIVNLFGFSRNSRYLPDRRDLNRYFPGSPRGSIAARMAHGFFENVVRHCDALVDFHTGSFDRSNLPQIRADLTQEAVLEFSRGFGATTVLQSRGGEGMLRVAATAAGIPSVTFEVGAPLRLQPEEIAFGVQAIDVLLHKLGIVPDRPDWDEPQPVYYQSRWVRANAGGMLISDVTLGESVDRGQRLGLIIDPLANSERAIVAPFDGLVLGMAQNQVVLPGFAIFHIGEQANEASVVEDAVERGEDPADEHDGDMGGHNEIEDN